MILIEVKWIMIQIILIFEKLSHIQKLEATPSPTPSNPKAIIPTKEVLDFPFDEVVDFLCWESVRWISSI